MSFSSIKGQDKPIEIIQGYISGGIAVNSFLFTGPEGIGKYLAAKELVKAVNCLSENAIDPCDMCVSCQKIEKGQHPDMHYIDSNLGIEDDEEPKDSDAIKIEHIRRLQKEISLRPYEGKKKVFIINDAHNMTAEAQNCLLKTLEEPPKDSLIILVSARPAFLFKTVLSRCKTVKFHSLKREELGRIMRDEHSLDPSLAHFLAYFCEGRIGQAIRLKNSGIMEEKNRVLDEVIFRTKHAYETRASLPRQKMREYLAVLLTWFRDAYMIKSGQPGSELINTDRKKELADFCAKHSYPELDEALRFLADCALYLEQNINTKLLLSNLKNLKVAHG